MSFERLKMLFQTLRLRLTLWNTALILVLLVVNLEAIRTGLQFTLVQIMDEFLDEELNSAVLYFDLLSDKPEQLHVRYNRQAISHPRRGLFIQLLDNNGRLAWSSEQSPSAELLSAGDRVFRGPATVGEHRKPTLAGR